MELVIVSPARNLYSGTVEEVSFPGTAGRFTVLPGHAPLLTSLDAGDIRYISDGQETVISVKSGCVRVLDDRVEACVETPGPVSGNEGK